MDLQKSFEIREVWLLSVFKNGFDQAGNMEGLTHYYGPYPKQSKCSHLNVLITRCKVKQKIYFSFFTKINIFIQGSSESKAKHTNAIFEALSSVLSW